jgi:outer membrane protein insertion porin family
MERHTEKILCVLSSVSQNLLGSGPSGLWSFLILKFICAKANFFYFITSMKASIIKKFFFKSFLLIFLSAQLAPAQESGGRLIVERIEILGARKTKPRVIHRYLSFQEGDSFTPELVEHDYQALVTTNFFKRVEFSTKPGSAKGKVIVVIEVQERSAPTLEFAGGYSELDGWYVSPIGVRYDNLFGTGHRLGLRAILGDRVGGFNFRYYQPEIFNRNMNVQVDFDALGRNLIHYFDGREAIQKVSTGSLRLSISGARGVARYFSAGYQASNIEPDSTAKFTLNDSTLISFPAIVAKNLGRKKMGMFWLRVQADTRDNVFFPRQGFWGALSVEAADRNFGGDLQFTRTIFDGRFYKKLGSGVLAVRLKTATTSKTTPYYERFYLGGVYSLRGFAERSLTPLGYGTRLFLGNLEWRVPLAGSDPQKPGLIGAIFLDAGSIGTPSTERDEDETFSAIGFGFRWKVPVVGLLRFDFAYPKQRPDDFRFHLGIGHPF